MPMEATADPLARYSLTPQEGVAFGAATRSGAPFLAYRTVDGVFTLFELGAGDRASVSVGRGDGQDLRLTGDLAVSRAHAQLSAAGREWVIQNLSRNRTYVNGRPISDPHRLVDGDRIQMGGVVLAFVAPGADGDLETAVASDRPSVDDLTATQRRVLIALCRPVLVDGGAPATNRAVAAEVFLGVEAVKDNLGRLYLKYGFGELEQNQKRAQLAALAVRTGLVTLRDLAD
jgi:hypothetical protein